MLCYGLLCYAMGCYAMLWDVMLCYAMLCYAITSIMNAALFRFDKVHCQKEMIRNEYVDENDVNTSQRNWYTANTQHFQEWSSRIYEL